MSGTDRPSLGPAVLAGHRAAGTLLRVEPGWVPLAGYAPGVAVMPLAGNGVLVTALSDDALTLRERLEWPGSADRRNGFMAAAARLSAVSG